MADGHPLPAADIAPLIAERKASRWAVDVRFGWPDLFVALMADRHHGPLPAQAMLAAADWEKWRTRQVAQPRTDQFLTDANEAAREPAGLVLVTGRAQRLRRTAGSSQHIPRPRSDAVAAARGATCKPTMSGNGFTLVTGATLDGET